jgi:hypothetical protein
MEIKLRLAALLLAAPLAGPRHVAAQDFRLFSARLPASHFFFDGKDETGFRIVDSAHSGPWIAEDRFSLRVGVGSPGAPQERFPRPPFSRPEAPRLVTPPAGLVTGGVLVLASIESMSAGWNHGFNGFHFHREHFFGPDTYAGGADKCSHFIISASLARELALLYDQLGHTPRESTALAFGVTALSGLILEAGDSFSPYGFSSEDLAADVLGTATGLYLTRKGLNDLIGLRVGKVPGIDESESTENLGVGYSNEIYSADLKLAGLASRLHIQPGVARFLLASITYNTKGYGHVPPLPYRTRNVGLELGVNFPEILSAVGVPETTWWGSLLYKALNFFRVPFTSFGFRYDINHGKWLGPDTGNKFR